MIVYHGSAEIVENPDVLHSFRPLDFGRGFYVTANYEQAERWAKRKADLLHNDKAYVNAYEMSDDDSAFAVKTFSDDLLEWIDFCVIAGMERPIMSYMTLLRVRWQMIRCFV